MNNIKGTFLEDDVIILLNDITGMIMPKSTEERERLIQSGRHYSEMLPLEYKPSGQYLKEYYNGLENFAVETAKAIISVTKKIYREKGNDVVLVSLARAGTPIGILIKRCLRRVYAVDAPHYTISIVRGRGIDRNAMSIITKKHSMSAIQFVDGWTGKGAIHGELTEAAKEFTGEQNTRQLLAVAADPANITDMCGTHDDIPIASSFLNSTVCGLMSRTIIRPEIQDGELHGVVFYDELRDEDRTYEFINRIESCFDALISTGIDEVRKIADDFQISDINLIKPGIGETTRVVPAEPKRPSADGLARP